MISHRPDPRDQETRPLTSTGQAHLDKIMERVRRLLDLAEHPATGEEEAAVASAHAAALMLRHGLDASAVRRHATGRPEQIDALEFDVSNRGGHARERCWSLHLVCDAMGCKAAQHWTTPQGRGIRAAVRVTMTIIGPTPVLDSLRLLLPSLTLQMEIHVKPALATYTPPPAANRESATKSFRRAFYVGFGAGVATKIHTQTTQLAEDLKDTTAALVLADRKPLVIQEFTRRFPGLRKARQTSLNPTGYHKGHQAGLQADLADPTLPDLPSTEQLPR
ncbi:DUF2786 domain-containing protein [Sphaerisporangium rubeum]|uniref:DUF2786 domain-containing protein n=1 Tax=Sphaerisporangium rubeum TaxID=321317 RepID=A0A7X0ICW6_9ACTN|nr:hypothetical protein [Sphaerisporangium rubeum]